MKTFVRVRKNVKLRGLFTCFLKTALVCKTSVLRRSIWRYTCSRFQFFHMFLVHLPKSIPQGYLRVKRTRAPTRTMQIVFFEVFRKQGNLRSESMSARSRKNIFEIFNEKRARPENREIRGPNRCVFLSVFGNLCLFSGKVARRSFFA